MDTDMSTVPSTPPYSKQGILPPRYQPSKPIIYTGDDRPNFERYLRAFHLNVTSPFATDMLALNLAGQALSYFNMYAPELNIDCQLCLDSLEHEFGIKQSFSVTSLHQKEGESAKEFTTRFTIGMRGAYGPSILTKPGNFKWILDTYCSLVRDWGAVLHIRSLKPTTLSQARDALEEYEAHSLSQGTSHPRAFSSMGPFPVGAPQPTSPPPQKERTWFGIKAPYKGKWGLCWFCGSKDHMIRECAEALKEFTRQGKQMPPEPKKKTPAAPPSTENLL